MTAQSTNEKSPPKPTKMRRKSMNLYIMNGTAVLVRTASAKKQKPPPVKNPETKINMDHNVKRGKALVLSSASGNITVASSKAVLCSRREAVLTNLKMRKDLSGHRCILHVINLVFHIVNLSSLHEAAETVTTPDPQVAKFLAMRFRYFTTWVVMLHIFYSASALALEVYREITKGPYPNESVKFQKPKFSVEVLFRGIIWPSTLVVTIFFWSLFNYDRALIFPEFVDEVISPGSNHVLHTWIAIFVILEVLVCPRLRPSTVAPNLRAMFTFLAVYLFVFYFTLFTEDIWLYPIFSVAYKSGIIPFLLLHLVLLALFLFSYALLWSVNDYFHKRRQFMKKQTRYFRIRWGSAAENK